MLRMTALTATVIFAGLWPKFGDDPLEHPFPVEAKGAIHFQMDAVFFLEDGTPALEVDIAIPRDALDNGDGSRDSIRIEVELLNENGNTAARYLTRMSLQPDTTTVEDGFPVPTRWIRLHPQWVAGVAGMRVEIEDLTRLKGTLLGQLQGDHPKGEAAGRISFPAWTRIEESPTSGLLFAWGQAESSPTQKSPGLRAVRGRLQPHPYRYYGLHQPVVTVYWERYPLPEATGIVEGDSLVANYRISKVPEGLVALERSETVLADAKPRWELKRFDVSGLASGAYRLDIVLHEPGQPAPLAETGGSFQVLWERGTWELDESQMLTYAQVLFSGDRYDEFAQMGRGEKERTFREYWNRAEPTPPGQRNPREMEFLSRVAYANHHFTVYRPGMLSDRGRVYIRLGPADEVSVNLNPQDEELLWNVLPRELEDDAETLTESMRRTRARTPFDNRAYEIWEYTVRGDPLVPEMASPGMQMGLKFIFVDELGFGDYSLVYTNIPGGLQ